MKSCTRECCWWIGALKHDETGKRHEHCVCLCQAATRKWRENAMTRYVHSKQGNTSNRKPKGVKPDQISERKRIGRNKRPRNARRKCPSKSILNRMYRLWWFKGGGIKSPRNQSCKVLTRAHCVRAAVNQRRNHYEKMQWRHMLIQNMHVPGRTNQKASS